MTDEITQENLSRELLKSILDSALMDTSVDADGDLRVRDRIQCFVIPSEQKDRIRLLACFGFKEGTPLHRQLEAVNRMNSEYVIARASAGGKDGLFFDYDIPVNGGGLTRKAFVLTVKRFLGIPLAAIDEHASQIVK